VRIRHTPAPITAKSNTLSRGSFFWKNSSETEHPIAAPVPEGR
jgi:hypothetical protein